MTRAASGAAAKVCLCWRWGAAALRNCRASAARDWRWARRGENGGIRRRAPAADRDLASRCSCGTNNNSTDAGRRSGVSVCVRISRRLTIVRDRRSTAASAGDSLHRHNQRLIRCGDDVLMRKARPHRLRHRNDARVRAEGRGVGPDERPAIIALRRVRDDR